MKQIFTKPWHHSHCYDYRFFRNALYLLLIFLACSIQLHAQTTVTGTVKDGNGNPLPGVNIIEKTTTNGTTTDADGAYRLAISSSNATLVFSFIGYQTEEVVVGNQTSVNVILTEDITSLQEVVVVGYGSERRADLTGSVGIVKTTEMTKLAASDMTQMLQGRVAGVAVNSDGQPGATPTVRIRGISTFGTNGTNAEPLYVVDGVPLSGGIRDFNPNDIETLQVLKDASAGAIYGSRAANGVIIVTTKRGKTDRPLSVEVNSYYGVQNIIKRVPVTNRVQYQMLNNEMLANSPDPDPAKRLPLPGNDPNSADFINNIDTDWQEETFKTGSIQNYSLNFSGGSKSSSYFLSLDHLNNKGTMVGNGPDYKRYSVRMNLESEKGIFKVGESLYLMRSNESPVLYFPDPGTRPPIINEALIAAPTIPLRDAARLGGYGGADGRIHNSISLNVPGFNSLIDQNTTVNRIFANVYGEIKLLDKESQTLTYRLNLGYDFTTAHDYLFRPRYDLGYFFNNTNAQLNSGFRNFTNGLVENTLNYEITAGKSNIKLLVGQTFQDFKTHLLSGTTSNLPEPYYPTLQNGTGTKSVTETHRQTAIFSLLGRLNYSYDDRYFLTANIRRDGSSNFAPANRFGVFPSVAVAWKLHNEAFMQLPDFISELKLRASWGQLGNQDIPPYSYQVRINTNVPYSFGDTQSLGSAITLPSDPNLQWEVRTTRSVGFDVSLAEGALEFTAEYYNNTSDKVLVGAPIPQSTGAVIPLGNAVAALPYLLTNAAGFNNTGFEFSAAYRKDLGNFSFEIAPNFYTLRNRIQSIYGENAYLTGAGSRSEVGGEMGRHYGYVYEGIFQSAEDIANHATQPGASIGDIKFKDVKPDGAINDADRQFLGKALPNFYYGLNATAKFKAFDFTLFASGSSGNVINNNLYRTLMSGNSFNNYHEDLLDRWTPANTNTDIPRMVHLDPNNNARDSNRPGWLESANYFRINTLSLGYTIPNVASMVRGFSSARFYFTAQNLHTFSKYTGFNPDFTAGILNPGFDLGTYPRPRTLMLGVQLRF